MTAEVIPLLIVDDVLVNVEYLEYALGFRLDNTVAEEELAVMKYRGATVMLQSRKAYAAGRGASFEKFVPADGIELMLQTDNLDEAYAAAVQHNAQVTRRLPGSEENFRPSIHRFSVVLPEGHMITFFAYNGEEPPI